MTEDRPDYRYKILYNSLEFGYREQDIVEESIWWGNQTDLLKALKKRWNPNIFRFIVKKWKKEHG